MHSYTNHLIHETSPYLLQHAHNPVDWYPWGSEALTRAKEEDKPILVSIGYSACHWCHVMERESFEDVGTAEIMNEYFINIKIDREERPDLDHIYMDAVQAMSGSGGWPLNVFLTPDARPFYGGTYFPPARAFNRSSWKEVLQGIAQAFKERRSEIDAQAQQMTDHLVQSNSFGFQSPGPLADLLNPSKSHEVFLELMKAADKEWGGFGKAPKFPQTFSIQYLLRYSQVRKFLFPDQEDNEQISKEALTQAMLSLDKMIDGGIYDQLGGGFARYSTDAEWLAPHFEKMLYDNALLIMVLSEAYQITHKEKYKRVIEETLEFVKRELMDSSSGFYSALDADSEGEEGKYYVWQVEEIEQVLGKDATIFSQYYDVSDEGNWEHKNILRVINSLENFATEHHLLPDELWQQLKSSRRQLLEVREKRVRPGLDDKIILSWNALMNTACSKAYAATGIESFRDLAISNMKFLIDRFEKSGDREFYHTWKEGKARYPAFLDDYAFLVQALINLQEITGDLGWLDRADKITGFVLEKFSEQETGFFFYTKEGQDDVIVRKKEVYDGAVPSGNSVMAGNLYYLGTVLDKTEWRERSLGMLGALGQVVPRYPTSFGVWACQLLSVTAGVIELVVLGPDHDRLMKEILQKNIPHKVIIATKVADQRIPLLNGKMTDGLTRVYVCKDYACLQPVMSVEEVMSLIDSVSRKN